MQQREAPPIETDRVILRSLSLDFLRLFSEQKVEEAQKLVDYRIPKNCHLLGHPQILRRFKMIEIDPHQHPWMYRAIVTKEDCRMVGFISFHHKAPDPDLETYSSYSVELGYTIEPAYRRKGYAKESAIAMMEWANCEHGVKEFFLTISPDNTPSLKLAETMGFNVVEEKEDPVDGLEYVMKAPVEIILKSRKAYQGAARNFE
ncbi:MAG: GNAT family N-acetyltransferase [Opitutales bacterium]|nr:GNAT family N-acetyltransferase [Opitutales bacterium]